MKLIITSFLIIFSTAANATTTDKKICTVTKLSWGGLLLKIQDDEKTGDYKYSVSCKLENMGDFIVQAISDNECDIIVVKSEVVKEK